MNRQEHKGSTKYGTGQPIRHGAARFSSQGQRVPTLWFKEEPASNQRSFRRVPIWGYKKGRSVPTYILSTEGMYLGYARLGNTRVHQGLELVLPSVTGCAGVSTLGEALKVGPRGSAAPHLLALRGPRLAPADGGASVSSPRDLGLAETKGGPAAVAKSISHLRNPGSIFDFPIAPNLWFPMVSKWCRISSIHSMEHLGRLPGLDSVDS